MISLYALSGQTLWTKNYINTEIVNIMLTAGLQKGLYIIEGINLRTHERAISKIMVQ